MTIEQALFIAVVGIFAYGFFRNNENPGGRRNGFGRRDFEYFEQYPYTPYEFRQEEGRDTFFETLIATLIAVIVVWYLVTK